MDRGEPTLAPEWYRSSTGSGITSRNSNHHSGSSRSDDHGVNNSLRNRLSVSAIDRDVPRSSAFADRSSSSSRTSASSNGTLSHGRESSSSSRSYSSFGRNSGNKVRENINDFRDRNRSHLVENGYSIYSDSYIGSRSGRYTLRRSHSMTSERRHEPITKRSGSDQKNVVVPGASIMHSIGRTSFERDFPSLGDEERQPEVARVSSPGLSTALDNLPRVTSTTIGGDGWTSALAEIPGRVGGSETAASSTTPLYSVDAASITLGSSTGLNMAETLTQAPRIHTEPQISVDSKKIEELTRLQYSKLIPMTPSMPKSLAINSSDKPKAKGARSGDNSILLKAGQNSSSQAVNHSRATGKSDTTRTSLAGNFQVLNRERNGITPTKDASSLMNAGRFLVPLGGVAPAISPPPKSPTNRNANLDIKGGFPSTNGERRPNYQAQKRNEFFNAIRQKAPLNRASDISDLKGSVDSENGAAADNDGLREVSNSSVHVDNDTSSFEPPVQRSIACSRDKSLPIGVSKTTPNPVVPVPAFNIVDEGYLDSVAETTSESIAAASPDPVAAPSEEEVAFLRQLGWDENAGGDEITPEEIEDFVRQHPEQKTSLKLAAMRFSLPSLVQSGVGGNHP